MLYPIHILRQETVLLQVVPYHLNVNQRAKKVVSDSPGLVDFVIGLVNSVLNLPDGQVKIFRRIKITKYCKTNVLNS